MKKFLFKQSGKSPLKYHLGILSLVFLVQIGYCRQNNSVIHDPLIEKIPMEESQQIKNIVEMTIKQLEKRYPGASPTLRGVHPKDHGCVKATFKVLDTIPADLQVGVFKNPGKEYPAWIRFSNADVLVRPDSSGAKHGSRGMAIKLMNVEGTPLVKKEEPITQDFLMVNHPVFAFANVEDYEAVSKALLESENAADPSAFFATRIVKNQAGTGPDLSIPMTKRALETLQIIKRIGSSSVGPDGAYQEPPISPVDNIYFSGAPYLFGPDKVMKFSAKPLNPLSGVKPNIENPSYLRDGLIQRLSSKDSKKVVFDFRVQIRLKGDITGKIEPEIENACFEWPEATYPFVTIATITIEPQYFDTPERRKQCENLFFTPWHGVKEHQPIGGINRLKLEVYQASGAYRRLTKEPNGF